MKWIGLTGGIASGKSTVAKMLMELGECVVDADVVARDVVQKGSPGLKAVVQKFGNSVLNSSQELDRAKMANLVFSDKHKLLELESILHPLIQEKVKQIKEAEKKQGRKLAFYDVPLLFEKKMQKQFDGILLVTCNENLQRKRLQSRNNFSDTEIDARLKNQLPLKDKIKESNWIVENNSGIEELQEAVSQVLKKIKATGD